MPTLRPYSSYRKTDLPWLGQIPAHWEAKRLKFVAPTSSNKLTDKPNDLPYVGLENIESGTGRLLMDTQPETVESNVGLFDKGDVLFGKLRPYLAKVAEADFRGSCTTEILALSPQKVYSRYLFYSLLSPRFIEFVNSMTYGTKMPRASWEQIGNMPISIPPLPEQQAIAAYLDRQTAKIDALIAKKQHLLDLLAEQRSALIGQAVTKGVPKTSEVSETSEVYALKDSGVAWLGQVPSHWEVSKIKFVAELESGHTPRKSIPEYWENCTIPWVSLNDVGYIREHEHIDETVNLISELGLAHSSARMLPKGTVILSRDASVGFCAILSRAMATSQHFVNWICGEKLYNEYLLLVLKWAMQQELKKLTMGSTVMTIGMPDVKSFTVPVPPIIEQEKIVSYVKTKKQYLDSIIAKTEKMIDHLHEYRAALISSVVTGKVKV